MDRREMKHLLEGVRAGKVGVDEALKTMRLAPLEQLEFATLDLHRELRRGFPEVIYGPGKTAEQVARIVERFCAAEQRVLVTRVGADVHEIVLQTTPRAVYHQVARAITVQQGRKRQGRPGVAVVTAGTSDLPVAEEAALTAEMMGQEVARVFDVGVAGIHRLFDRRETLVESRVIVVVAGMEGALPSVVAGITDCPVIGVPTSTGYGVGADGQVALMAMLCSCAAGVTVVNIDNGFGAGYAAALINLGAGPRRRESGQGRSSKKKRK